MQWFTKLKESFLPTKAQEQQETQELVATVAADRKIMQNASSAPGVTKSVSQPIPTSTLSPFGSRILEKAKIESLKSDEERQKMTSPAQLFLTSEEAKNRVGHIQSIQLERSKNAASPFTSAAHPKQETQFNAFMKKAEKNEK
ncbi:MAG: hypothetical protein KBD46_00760 [Candidatus Levybacteria bacterium]|nr:hypothetical protein [Candidatus Levybacteria bacterium]